MKVAGAFFFGQGNKFPKIHGFWSAPIGILNSIGAGKFRCRVYACAKTSASLLSLPVVINGNHAAIQFNDRTAPRQVSIGSLVFGMLDSPGDDLPSIPLFLYLPFGPVGPILLLLQQSFRNRDLVVKAALRILGLFHAGGLTSAAAEQPEKQGNNPASGHPPSYRREAAPLELEEKKN
jgi:hypothetical protein